MVCLDLAGRGIMIASWLAAVSRRELSRFKEFMQWLRHGSVFALRRSCLRLNLDRGEQHQFPERGECAEIRYAGSVQVF